VASRFSSSDFKNVAYQRSQYSSMKISVNSAL
jgi:hypothetical protein